MKTPEQEFDVPASKPAPAPKAATKPAPATVAAPAATKKPGPIGLPKPRIPLAITSPELQQDPSKVVCTEKLPETLTELFPLLTRLDNEDKLPKRADEQKRVAKLEAVRRRVAQLQQGMPVIAIDANAGRFLRTSPARMKALAAKL